MLLGELESPDFCFFSLSLVSGPSMDLLPLVIFRVPNRPELHIHGIYSTRGVTARIRGGFKIILRRKYASAPESSRPQDHGARSAAHSTWFHAAPSLRATLQFRAGSARVLNTCSELRYSPVFPPNRVSRYKDKFGTGTVTAHFLVERTCRMDTCQDFTRDSQTQSSHLYGLTL